MSILITDCIYLSAYKYFNFQLENDDRMVETSLFFDFNFYSEKQCYRLRMTELCESANRICDLTTMSPAKSSLNGLLPL